MTELNKAVVVKSVETIGTTLGYLLAAFIVAAFLTASWMIGTGLVVLQIKTARMLGWL